MAPDLADHAYAHCVAVLIRAGPAEEAGREALRRGARTVTGVLAHARFVALSGSPKGGLAELIPSGFDAGSIEVGSAPLPEVARWLSATRPPIERAIVDLHGRHGLDRLRFARCLGLRPTAAAVRAAAVADDWTAALDPALLARLGPGGCEGLGQVLSAQGLAAAGDHDEPTAGSDGPPDVVAVTVGRLLAAAPAVSAHVEACEQCRDRRRAMVSVEDLVVGIPLETAPANVRVVRRDSGRRRRPVPLPPSIVSDLTRRPRRRAVLASALAAVVVVVGAGGAAIAERGHRNGQVDRVQALTKIPATNALSAVPGAILVPGGAFVLANLSGRAVHWQASSPVPWLSLDPPSGTLGPHGQTRVRATLGSGGPGGAATATIAIAGDDGSATAVGVSASGPGSADLAASASGCTVTATAEAPLGITGVALHWLGVTAGGTATTSPPGAVTDGRGASHSVPPPSSDEHVITMVNGDTGYTATLPPASSPIQWWVTAGDANGNEAQTPRQVLSPGTCS